MELADALARQTAVVKLQDVPDVHRHRDDLLGPHVVLALHGAVTSSHVYTVQDGGNGRLEHGQHQVGVVGPALAARCLLGRSQVKRKNSSFIVAAVPQSGREPQI